VSRANVGSSLDAVELALEHFSASLDRAGFRDGAAAYRQMADVIVGQWMWAEERGDRELQPRFLRIAALAGLVADQLRPYVGAMDRLRGIRGLAADAWGIEAGSVAEQVVEALAAADKGLTISELRRATGASTMALRRELDALAGKGLLAAGAGGPRGRYALVGGPARGPGE
jgi:hypothetical protein